MRMIVSAVIFGILVTPAALVLGFDIDTWRWVLLIIAILSANDIANWLTKAIFR